MFNYVREKIVKTNGSGVQIINVRLLKFLVVSSTTDTFLIYVWKIQRGLKIIVWNNAFKYLTPCSIFKIAIVENLIDCL